MSPLSLWDRSTTRPRAHVLQVSLHCPMEHTTIGVFTGNSIRLVKLTVKIININSIVTIMLCHSLFRSFARQCTREVKWIFRASPPSPPTLVAIYTAPKGTIDNGGSSWWVGDGFDVVHWGNFFC